MIRVSIITVNLNNSEGLRKTVQSVAGQTFKDFEYILVDGASTDGSLNIIQKTTGMGIPHFQWISEPDSGVYDAMNKGIRHASGEYLLFLNSGDYLVDEYVLEKVFSEPKSSGFLLGKCNVSENGKVLRTTNPPERLTFGYLYQNALAHQSTFIKREMFLKYGFYREDFRYNADIEFWYRTIVLNCCSTVTLPIIISDYNTGGISSAERESERYRNEMEEIFSNPLLQLFIPDYDLWLKERQEMKILYWVKSKLLIYSAIRGLFKSAHWFSKMMK